MPRVKLQELSSYPFSVELDVRVADLNYGGHLGFERLLALAHEARVRLFRQLGASELDLGGGVGVIAVDLSVVYLGQAFIGDRLRFEIAVAELRRASVRLAHRVRRVADDADIARIEVCLAGYDHRDQRVSELPAALHDSLSELVAP